MLHPCTQQRKKRCRWLNPLAVHQSGGARFQEAGWHTARLTSIVCAPLKKGVALGSFRVVRRTTALQDETHSARGCCKLCQNHYPNSLLKKWKHGKTMLDIQKTLPLLVQLSEAASHTRKHFWVRSPIGVARTVVLVSHCNRRTVPNTRHTHTDFFLDCGFLLHLVRVHLLPLNHIPPHGFGNLDDDGVSDGLG